MTAGLAQNPSDWTDEEIVQKVLKIGTDEEIMDLVYGNGKGLFGMDIAIHEFERNKAKQVMMLARQSEHSKIFVDIIALMDAKIAELMKNILPKHIITPGEMINGKLNLLRELRAEIEKMQEHCGSCIAVCPNNALRFEKEVLVCDESKCSKCGACIKVCPERILRFEEIHQKDGSTIKLVDGRCGRCGGPIVDGKCEKCRLCVDCG